MVDVMLQPHSALAGEPRFERNGISIAEAPDFTLVQVAGDDKAVKKALGKLPARVGTLVKHGDATVFHIAPKQYWLVNGEAQAADGCHVTPLSSSRTRIAISGPLAREVLAAVIPVDVHAAAFKPEQFVMTGIHHTPAMVHCVGKDEFHVYAMRSFARNVLEVLVDAAEGVLLYT
jgi:sarcosine oxidase subunit gamma